MLRSRVAGAAIAALMCAVAFGGVSAAQQFDQSASGGAHAKDAKAKLLT